MTTLDQVKTMTDAQIQAWLKKVEKLGVSTLVNAMLGADAEVHGMIMKNMSEKAGAVLKQNIDDRKKTRITDDYIQSNAKRVVALMEIPSISQS
jgi:flagellar motor switch protein FliG